MSRKIERSWSAPLGAVVVVLALMDAVMAYARDFLAPMSQLDRVRGAFFLPSKSILLDALLLLVAFAVSTAKPSKRVFVALTASVCGGLLVAIFVPVFAWSGPNDELRIFTAAATIQIWLALAATPLTALLTIVFLGTSDRTIASTPREKINLHRA